MADGHATEQVTSTDSGYVCEPCKFDNIERPAAGWCEDCDEKLCDNCHTTHRKLKQTRDHKFWSVEDMAGRKQRPKVSNRCEKHEGKRLEYFCVDHSVLDCGQCFVAAHRHCNEVICIAEFNTIGSEEFKALESLLETLDSRLGDINEKAGRNKELSASQYDKVIADIEGAGEKLKSLIDRLVKDQVEKVEKARDDEMRNMTDIEETNADVADKVNTNQEMLTAVKTDNCQLFVTMKHVQGEATGLKSKLDSVEKTNTVTEKVFVLNRDLATVLDKVKELGTWRETKIVDMEKATDEVVEVLEVMRYQIVNSGWGYSGEPDAIQLSTNQNILLLYVLLYPCKNVETSVELIVNEGSNCLLRCNSIHMSGTENVIGAKVIGKGGGHGVTLRTGQCYDIVVTIKGGETSYGIYGNTNITVDGIKFTFSNSPHSKNGTDTTRGQIAGFRFARV